MLKTLGKLFTRGSAAALPPEYRPAWSETPREFVIDLSAVGTRDQFMQAMAPHFPVGPGHRDIWDPIFDAILHQSCPFRIQFLGWHGFAGRMPRYARRLRRYFDDYQQRHGEERLYLEYGG